MCPIGPGFGDEEIAATIVHATSHLYDFTVPMNEEHCPGGRPDGMTTAKALDTADAYSEFAQEILAERL